MDVSQTYRGGLAAENLIEKAQGPHPEDMCDISLFSLCSIADHIVDWLDFASTSQVCD